MTDTTAALWDKHYKISVPYILSLEDDALDMYGVRITGDKKMDEDLKNQWMVRWSTVADMVKFFRRGVAVSVARTDTKTIYEDIVRHINACKRVLENELNYNDPELLQDLLDLDRFAISIYEHAKWQFDPNHVPDKLYQAMSGLTTLNRDNLLKYRPKVTESEFEDSGTTYINGGIATKLPDHEDSSEFLRSKLASLGAF